MQATEAKVTAYQIIGWYDNIRPDDRRSDTLSDGAIFSTLDLAMAHVLKRNMTISRINELSLRPDDPQIDHLLR